MATNVLTDTDRLNFLLKYFRVDYVGDEEYIPGIVVIKNEDLEDVLTWGRPIGAVRRNQCDTDDLRHIIDMSIRKNKDNEV